jgi:ArsR family transcriptional regulator
MLTAIASRSVNGVKRIRKSAKRRGNKHVTPHLPAMPDEMAKDLVQLFKLLADETRLRILHLLTQQDELNVRSLCELLGQSQPAVSHHLALLRVAGLIESRRDGKHNFYHLILGRFQQILERVFNVGPNESRRISFNDHVLSYAPASSSAAEAR